LGVLFDDEQRFSVLFVKLLRNSLDLFGCPPMLGSTSITHRPLRRSDAFTASAQLTKSQIIRVFENGKPAQLEGAPLEKNERPISLEGSNRFRILETSITGSTL
jgi:hypothetical protein